MNNDDTKLNFTKDEVKEGYKLGKILATSAIVSDAPLGPVKPKRTKQKLVILALILGYFGFAVYSNQADATQTTSIWTSYIDTPYNLGSLCTENKWGNLCPSEVKS